jgi:flagellar L-ring protein precursor FlgH
VGEHRIKVNEETEMIQISGILKPDYINDQNAVFSYQIADLQITLQGDGVVADKQTPGFFSRITSWLF